MSNYVSCLGAALAFVVLSGVAVADPRIPPAAADVGGGDSELGLAYARQTCVMCHAVEANDKASTDMNAPPFSDIANMPGLTRRAFNAWLHSEHDHMPNFIVEPNRVDDLYAYIASLKTPSPH